MSEIKAFIMEVPAFTRYFLGATLAASFGMTYKMINPYYMILDFELLFKKL